MASCFFLDTAYDIVQYLTCIYGMLAPGGVLVNLGPMLWHWSGRSLRPGEKRGDLNRPGLGEEGGDAPFAASLLPTLAVFSNFILITSLSDDRYASSVDFSYEDVRSMMVSVGFEVVEERLGVECEYTRDERSMMFTRYRCVFFVAKKPEGGGGKKPEEGADKKPEK